MALSDKDVPGWSEKHLRLAVTAAGVTLWSWNVDTNRLVLDARAYDLWGVPHTVDVSFEDLSSRIHPADQDRVRAAFDATRGLDGAFEIDFRIMVGEEVRWVSARGNGGEAEMLGRLRFGVFLDVTGRKHAEEANELLAGEMSHRVKNLLTIAASLTSITSRSSTTTVDMARQLTQRLIALGRANDLVRPAQGKADKSALLGDLIAVLMAPYDDGELYNERIRVSVPRIGVNEAAAMALALVIHELATNALKYGALSNEAGMLDVTCTAPENEAVLVWTERGGPPVTKPEGSNGFGSKLVQMSVAGQLGGKIDYNWDAEGLIVTLRMDLNRIGEKAV